MLSADFSLAATGLVLDGFDGARELSISETEGEYRFTLDQGQWRQAADSEGAGELLPTGLPPNGQPPNSQPPEGVSIEGQTLVVDKLAVDPLSSGVTVVAPGEGFQLDVSIDGVDFSGLAGGLTLDGVSSVNSPAAVGLASSTSGGPAVAALLSDPATLTLGSLDFEGDLNLIASGSIGDTPGAQITVDGDLTIVSRPLAGVAGIQFAENSGDLLSVTGNATFEAQSADAAERFDIHVGVDGSGNQGGDATFGSVSVFGGKATLFEADSTTLDDSDAQSLGLTSGGSITDSDGATIDVADNARFTAANPADNDITLDASNNFGSLTFDGGAVTVVEQSSTRLVGENNAETLDLDSAGAITNDPSNAVPDPSGPGPGSLSVTGLADFNSTTGDAITLDQTNRFGSLRFNGGEVEITEADATELSGISTAASLSLRSSGEITDDPSADVTVIGNARFESSPGTLPSGAPVFRDITLDSTHRFGSLTVQAEEVVVNEADGTVFSGSSQTRSLELNSAGAIADDGTASLIVSDRASFESTTGNAITLDDTYYFGGTLDFTGGVVQITAASDVQLGNTSAADSLVLNANGPIGDDGTASLTVAGNAAFNAAPVLSPSTITLEDNYQFGSLTFNAGAVRITEADGTTLSGVSNAESLNLISGGPITDDGTANVNITGNARFESGPGATGGASAITLDDAYNFGSLTFDGGAVTILEQSGAVLSGESNAATLDLFAAGSIVDDGTAVVDVADAADFTSLTGSVITLDDAYTFGSLRFSGGDVTISEGAGGPVPGTLLAGSSLAASLALTSAGAITDTGDTVLTVIGNASFDSTVDGEITLDDTYNFGSLTFDGGSVTIFEQSGTVLAGDSAASQLQLTSANGSITDQIDATLEVSSPSGDATLRAAESIVLADAGSANQLQIEGLGSFTAGNGREIAIGVVPSTGLPADASAQIGQLQFEAFGGNARVALDGNVTLTGRSQAADIELNAFGSGFNITDLPGSDVTFDSTAILRAAEDNIVLGDAAGADASRFGHRVSPAVFDASEFLALEATNVSIVADTGINLRTGPNDTAFAGTFFLRAAGTIAQVGEGGLFTPLTAERVALASGGVEIDQIVDGEATGEVTTPAGGAVLFSRINLTGDDGLPNLAIEAGGAESFADLIAGREEFPTTEIAGGADGEFLPVNIADRSGATPFLDTLGNDQGLEFLPNGQVTEPTDTFGDRFSIVAVVEGDATVGVVTDATNPQTLDQSLLRPDQVGIEVTDATGNAFLRTITEVIDGDAPAETGDLLFTSFAAPTETVVSIQAGVFTAIADGVLTIDTTAPDLPTVDFADGAITTRLTSSTGTVTSVAAFETVLGTPLDLAPGLPIDPADDLIVLNPVGPRFILDPPSDALGAGTTDQVFSGENEEVAPLSQTVTFAIGSRGEDGLIVEFEWADVLLRRESPLEVLPVSLAPDGVFPGEAIFGPNGDLLFDPLSDPRPNPLVDTEGTIPLPQVTLAPADLDSLPTSNAINLTDPTLGFRIVTVTHTFSEAFIQSNELVTLLPTTIRVYNDPSINLFDLGGERSLNENANFLEPDIAQTAGFFLPIPRDQPTPFPIVEPTVSVAPPVVAPTPAADADLQSTIVSEGEKILFGRRDGDVDGDGFGDNIPGEAWPQEWQGADGDFIEQIRQLIDEGPYSEGEYRIISESPRGTQELEVWVKGDAADEESIDDGFGFDLDGGLDHNLGGRLDEAPALFDQQGAAEPAADAIRNGWQPAVSANGAVTYADANASWSVDPARDPRINPVDAITDTLAPLATDRHSEALQQSLGVTAGLVVGWAAYHRTVEKAAPAITRGARRRRRVQQLLADARRAGRRSDARRPATPLGGNR